MEWRNIGILLGIISVVGIVGVVVIDLAQEEEIPVVDTPPMMQMTESKPFDTPPDVKIEYEIQDKSPVNSQNDIKRSESTKKEQNRTQQMDTSLPPRVPLGNSEYKEQRTYLGKTFTADKSYELIYSCFDNNITLGIHDGFERATIYGYVDSHAYILDYILPERYPQSCSLEARHMATDTFTPLFNIRIENLKPKSYNMLTIDIAERDNYVLLENVEKPPSHMGYQQVEEMEK